MPQPMPVIRQLNPAGLIPQLVVISLLGAMIHGVIPAATFPRILVGAALTYYVVSVSLRHIFTEAHIRGMAAYRAGRFEEAISHFQRSHDYFSTHIRLDAWRAFLFGVATYNPYRIIALGNMAYCYAQLGNGAKAAELFETVLAEVPDHSAARSSLNLLKAGLTKTDPPPSAAPESAA